MPTIVRQFDDGKQAAKAALKLVEEYLKLVPSQSQREKMIAKYAHCVGKGGSQASAIAVFDIDDTLVFDMQPMSVPHPAIVNLLQDLHNLGVSIHLVTARLDEPSMHDETLNELRRLGIKYKSLHLAPAEARITMPHVSEWKMRTRRNIATEHSCAVTLTVGDQWGDMVVLEDEKSIDKLDREFGTRVLPYLIVRPEDNVSLWGLKLPAY